MSPESPDPQTVKAFWELTPVGVGISILDFGYASVMALDLAWDGEYTDAALTMGYAAFGIISKKVDAAKDLYKVANSAPKYARDKYKSVTRTEKKRVLEENKTCVYCDNKPSTQVDHIRSQKQDWVEGGFKDTREVRSARVNDPSNLTGSCQSCNASKGSKPLGNDPDQWTPPKDR